MRGDKPGDKQRRWRQSCKLHGLCVRCGKRKAYQGVHCIECAEIVCQYAKEWQRRKYEEKR